jgi:conserved repeat domain
MNKFINAIKSAPKRSLALAVALMAVIVPVAASAWGPNRTTYTIESPATKVTFNSITNNPNIGDERNFVGIRERGSNDLWSDNIEVKRGKEYVVRLYVHNNAAANLNLVAENVKAMINLPTTTGKSIEVNGFIDSSNADPKQIWDNAKFFNNNEVFNLAYVAGSARYFNNHYGSTGVQISDSVLTSNGALLGYDSLNGRIPGCMQYAGYLTITVKPQFAETEDFTIDKVVRKDGQTGDSSWKESITVNAGDLVNYELTYKNTGTTTQTNVMVRDVLPKNISYVAGTTVIYNAKNPNGLKLSDNLTTTGVNIGDYTAGSNAIIRFTAKVASEDKLACGKNTLINYGQVDIQVSSVKLKQDTATVIVNKECKETPPKCTVPGKEHLEVGDPNCKEDKKMCTVPGKEHLEANDPKCKEDEVPELPKTGPASIIGGILGIGSLTSSIAYYIISRKRA